MKRSVFFRVTLCYVELVFLSAVMTCSQAGTKKPAVESPASHPIESVAQLNGILDSAENRLLMFDLYADWCLPCRQLSPILEKIAADMKPSVAFYKINIDQTPDVASIFQVSGIPFVVFVKNKTVVQALVGLQPEAAYRRAITLHGIPAAPSGSRDQPDGELVNGVRVITLSTATTVRNLYVYRGEEVKLVFNKVDFPYSVHIPALKVSGSAKAGENCIVTFNAKEAGVFPMMCIGKCPVGDGQQFAKIIVLEYEADVNKASFKTISPETAQSMIAKEKPLLLDVRTPNEYYDHHIANATLIPLQQLADRIGELAAYKNQPIIVYCRTGNRSIPASQILIRNGFKQVYNMKSGIVGWMNDTLPLEMTR